MATRADKFLTLLQIMARLRAPGGCPWDREQTFDSIKPYTLEETYEVMEAIDNRDWPHLAEELGDLLLQVVFYAQMAEEAGYFTIEDSLDAVNRKLIRRHPHVFGEGSADTAGEVKKRWDEIKAEENREKGKDRTALLDRVPKALPALVEAHQMTRKAAEVGFDWPSVDGVIEKLQEEVRELAAARAQASPEAVEGELGDLLFVLVNLARFLDVDPEQALRKTNAKFRRRFGHVEESLKGAGRGLSEAGLEEMEALWQEAKRQR